MRRYWSLSHTISKAAFLPCRVDAVIAKASLPWNFDVGTGSCMEISNLVHGTHVKHPYQRCNIPFFINSPTMQCITFACLIKGACKKALDTVRTLPLKRLLSNGLRESVCEFISTSSCRRANSVLVGKISWSRCPRPLDSLWRLHEWDTEVIIFGLGPL